MIDRFNLLYGEGTRTVSFDNGTTVAATVGTGSYVSDAGAEYGSLKCHVLIGRYCSIAHRVTFEVGLNHDYHYATTYPFDDIRINDPFNINHFDEANKNQVVIGNDVWIGCDVIILGGVHIGNGAVIGAGAVVAKDVPPYAIVVGNPARVIKYRFEPEIIQRLQNIKWWYWPAEQIKAKYPLMKAMDRFLADSKELPIDENVDETVQALQTLKEDGYYIYYIVADFNITDSVWRSVLTEYLNNFSDDNKVLLVVEIIGEGNKAFLDEMSQMVENRGSDAPIVVTHPNTNVISKALLRLVDTYITTKEDSSSVVVDFLSDMDAEVMYGLDYGGHIFAKKSKELFNNISTTSVKKDEVDNHIQVAYKKKSVERIITNLRRSIRSYIESDDLDSAFAEIFGLAQILYEYNQIYTDDALETDLLQLDRIISAPKITGKTNDKLVLFYDGFGLNDRGLAEIYLDAIDAAGYRILYISTIKAQGHIPKLKAVLDRNGAKEIYMLEDNTVELYQKLCEEIAKYCPSKGFLYTTPYDVPGLLAFMHQEGKMIRYQVNLTDHAFWLGRNTFDYCLEFRDYGASISANYRKIPATKLIRMNYYPAFDPKRPFEGFPFNREKGDFVIFSGGFLYKTIDEHRTYYKIVEHCLQHKNVKFWYAGYGDSTELQALIKKYPGRVFYTAERSDLFAVMKNIDMYLSTYPIVGGLMYQYSAMAGRAPLTLVKGNESLGILLGDTEMKAFTYNIEDHLKSIDLFITDVAYRRELEKDIKEAVCTREDFIDRMRIVLESPQPSVFDLTPVDTEAFRAGYMKRFLDKVSTAKK